MENVRVLCCRASQEEVEPALAAALRRCAGREVDFVGPRPGKQVDPLLSGRVLVLGDDADLAAVVLRLLRRDLLGQVVVGFVTGSPTAVTHLWSLPTGPAAVDLAIGGDPDLVPLVRDDVGGVLVGLGRVLPVRGTVYLDDQRVLSGTAAQVLVEPDTQQGLAVTVVPRRILGFGRNSRTLRGRAVAIGTTPATVISDDVPHPRAMDRWTYYRHTQPLRLVRGVLG